MTSAVVLMAAWIFTAVGMYGELDLNRLLGEWRSGVFLLIGSALLFSYTIRLHLIMQYRGRDEDLKRLHHSNMMLAERVRRRLQGERVSTRD